MKQEFREFFTVSHTSKQVYLPHMTIFFNTTHNYKREHLVKWRNFKHTELPHTNKMLNSKYGKYRYNITLRSFRVISLTLKAD